VAWGLMCAALLGHEIGLTPADDVSRIVALVRHLGPLPPWTSVPPKTLIQAMRSDKKSRGGKLRFVLAPRVGSAGSYDNVPVAKVERVLRFAPHFLTEAGKFNG
jgi:3-dehydroquinate synthetase